MTYEAVVQLRREFKIDGDKYKTLTQVDFDGPWVTPYQISSRSPSGPVLVAYHWLDDASIDKHRSTLKERGFLPEIIFNRVIDEALKIVGKKRSDIYVTQAFHLVPSSRSARIERKDIDESFDKITRHELAGRHVIALGCEVAAVCKRFGIDHQPVAHPSARGRTIKDKAEGLAAAIR